MRNNLPPESQPWARDVDQRISALERQASRAAQDSENAISMLNTRVTQIIDQQGSIQDSIRRLNIFDIEYIDTSFDQLYRTMPAASGYTEVSGILGTWEGTIPAKSDAIILFNAGSYGFRLNGSTNTIAQNVGAGLRIVCSAYLGNNVYPSSVNSFGTDTYLSKSGDALLTPGMGAMKLSNGVGGADRLRIELSYYGDHTTTYEPLIFQANNLSATVMTVPVADAVEEELI